MTEPHDHEHMRRLMSEAVSDVDPAPGLDAIRSRTSSSRPVRRTSWVWTAGTAAVATAATVAAVSMLGGDPGTPGTQGPGVANGPAQAAQSAWAVYFEGDTGRGPKLYRETHSFAGRPRVEVLQRAIDGSADDPDYGSSWPEGTTVASITVQQEQPNTVAVVDLGGGDLGARPSGVSPGQAEAAVQQALWTLRRLFPPETSFLFSVDGRRVDTLLGVPVERPVTAADDALAQVWIDQPAEGAEVRAPFQVTGLANAFEANVQWELVRSGRVVESGFTTARECCTMAPYSFTVEAPPGQYTLVVHDTDPSGGEGFPPWRDTKRVTVLG